MFLSKGGENILPKRVPLKSFVAVYKKTLYQRHLTTAQVTRNGHFSSSFIYSILVDNPPRKTVYFKTVKRIGEALGLSSGQFARWITEMVLYKRVKDNRDHMDSQLKKVKDWEPEIDWHSNKDYAPYQNSSDNENDTYSHQTNDNNNHMGLHEYRRMVINDILKRLIHLRNHDLKMCRIVVNKFYFAEQYFKEQHRHKFKNHRH